MSSMMSVLQGDYWLTSFFLNILGYGTVIIPAALAIHYLKNSESIKNGSGPFYSFLRCCVIGGNVTDALQNVEEGGTPAKDKSLLNDETSANNITYYVKLVLCVVGLQISYLFWGILQERIMTRSYDGDIFKTSQFLVFLNRILALLVSSVYLLITTQPRHIIPPFYKYSYSSLSNVLSSWCQYEALKYVSFPTQVLSKSCKVIPVMLMGKLVSNKTYPWHEYITAGLMSLGVALFLLAADPTGHKHTTETTVAGVFILLGYMWFDSFTSNWQSQMFNEYKMSSVQMMFGVNVFSSLLTLSSLLFRGSLIPSLIFFFQHFEFITHAIILSTCSAVGQLFIFYTIAQFGPLIFTLIMTTRQAVSILISCLIYGHVLTMQALTGLMVVFLALFLRIYCRQKNRPK